MIFRLRGATRSVVFPANPEAIRGGGAPRVASYDTLEESIEQPAGGTPRRWAWDGMLPGRARRNKPWVHRTHWQEPEALNAHLEYWRDNDARLAFTVTETRIAGERVFIASYDSTRAGGYGDITYTIEVVEYRRLDVDRRDKGGKKRKREPKPAASKAKGSGGATKDTKIVRYTVKSGDTLSKIAKRFLGSTSRWREIYADNKSTIGNNPNAITPGMVLRIRTD